MVKKKRAAAPESVEQAGAPAEDAHEDAAPEVRKKRRKAAAVAEAGAVEEAAAGAALVERTAGEEEEEKDEASGSLQAKKKKKAKVAAVTEAGAAEGAAAGTEEEEKDEASEFLRSKKKRKLAADTAADAEPGASSAAADGTKKKAKDTESDDVERTVFVDGVPYDWTLEQIRELFQQCGGVKNVRAPTWQDSGRLRGYAHVTFIALPGQKKALAMDGHVIKKGRYLKIEVAKAAAEASAVDPADAKGKRRLFVKNLPFDAMEEDIAKMFGKCGRIVEVRVPTAHGRAKGFAYIEFVKCAGLAKALKMHPPPEMGGRKLRLDVDAGMGPRAGFHYRPEAYEAGYGKQKEGGGRGAGGGGRGAGKLSLF